MGRRRREAGAAGEKNAPDNGIHGREGVPWPVMGEFHAQELVAFSLEAKLEGRSVGGRKEHTNPAGVGAAEAEGGSDNDGVLHGLGSLNSWFC